MNDGGIDPIADPGTREARMLAAIVFTDVVGFSKLAKENEARVYVALQRDMGVMTNLCRAHGGQVLNTMGDGMLLYFGSAVDALSCAVEIQRTLYHASLSMPTVDVLHHRIGVHLGDVIMSGDNVFGDGVNVAARLQALAKPDAICFSNTVYEVVKNKLKVDATYLGPQQLKNLGEPVKVWQVPPLGQPQTPMVPDPGATRVAAEPVPTGLTGAKAVGVVLVSLALIGGIVFGFSKIKAPPFKPSPSKTRTRSEETTAPTNVAVTPSTNTKAPTKDEVAARLAALKKTYAFGEIVQLLETNGSMVEDGSNLLLDFRQLAKMQAFVQQQLAMTSGADTIEAESPEGTIEIYQLQNQVYFKSATVYSKTFDQMTPEEYLAVAKAALAKPKDGSTAPADSGTWLQLFSKEYGLPVTS